MKKALTVLAALGLVLAITGGAFAAKGLLTGADIKKGSLTGANIRTHSVGAGVFTASARKSLTGARGKTGTTGAAGLVGAKGSNGSTGATGAAGAAGAAGANGTVSPLSAVAAGPTALAAGTPATVVSVTVPAGRYVVSAKTQVSQVTGADSVTCLLESGAFTVDTSATKTGPANFAATLPLQAVTTVGASTVLSVFCLTQTGVGSAINSSIIAIPTS